MKKYEMLGQTKGRLISPTYNAWRNMVQRCVNANRPDFHHYGGRGIKVCARWAKSYRAFLEDMGERPHGTSIDRINNAAGYSKNNCRWATKDQQMQNTRHTRLITFQGQTMGLNAWAKKLGMNKESLRSRLAKWTLEDAMTRGKRK